MATTGMSMAPKSSNLDDQISGANLQIEGCTPTSPCGQKGLKEIGPSGSAPSQSLERQLLLGHPETQYCLGICVTLNEERGAALLLPYTWTAPVVEDML